MKYGRGDWIRTSDRSAPSRVLYQTELLPDRALRAIRPDTRRHYTRPLGAYQSGNTTIFRYRWVLTSALNASNSSIASWISDFKLFASKEAISEGDGAKSDFLRLPSRINFWTPLIV